MGVRVLIYNPTTFDSYAEINRLAAPAFVQNIKATLPGIATAVDVGCGTGEYVAALAAGGVLYYMGWQEGERAREAGLAGTTLVPVVTADGGAAMLWSGRF